MQIQELPPERQLEWYTAEALRKRGYQVQPETPEELGRLRLPSTSQDRQRQIDVYAARHTGLIQENLLVECKCHKEKIPAEHAEKFSMAVREIRGSLSGSVQGIFVSISELTDDARNVLQKQGIEVYEGTRVKDLIGHAEYAEVTRALLVRTEEYYGKVSFLAESIIKTLQVRGASTVSLENVEARYDPVIYCMADISCRKDVQPIRKPIPYNRKAEFLVFFRDGKLEICDVADGVSAEALRREAQNLNDMAPQEINKPSASINPSSPLIQSSLIDEACKRGKGIIYYSEVLQDWREEIKELRTSAFEKIREMEESDARERRRQDEGRLYDLKRQIGKAEADLEEYRFRLAALDKQSSNAYSIQGRINKTERTRRDCQSLHSQISERLSNDLNAMTRRFEKMRSEAVKELLVTPETSEVSLDPYVVWLPVFQAIARLTADSKHVDIRIKWNGMSGTTELGYCKTCGIKIAIRGDSLCFACMHLICRSHTEKCSHCLRFLCEDDVWVCPLCTRKFCHEEQRFVCDFCKTTGCLECRFICTDCGVHLCKNHVAACARCGRTLCPTHKLTCELCGCAVCSSDLEQCTGCKRSVCRSHLLICPRCGKRVCEQCLRKKTTVRSALRGKLRETRCVLCLGLPDAHISI
jgi:hypothetical protein